MQSGKILVWHETRKKMTTLLGGYLMVYSHLQHEKVV